MAQFPMLPLWTDSYLADTTHLTTIQHGAYFLMLLAAWRNKNCRLKLDEEYLCKITKLSVREWRRNAETLLEFWRLEDGFLYQDRLLKERALAEARSEKATKAAEVRWGKRTTEQHALASPEDSLDYASNSNSISKSKNRNSGLQKGSQSRSEHRPIFLRAETYEEARKIAPGYDVHALEARWQEWTGPVNDPDKAYLAFVRKHIDQNPL